MQLNAFAVFGYRKILLYESVRKTCEHALYVTLLEAGLKILLLTVTAEAKD